MRTELVRLTRESSEMLTKKLGEKTIGIIMPGDTGQITFVERAPDPVPHLPPLAAQGGASRGS